MSRQGEQSLLSRCPEIILDGLLTEDYELSAIQGVFERALSEKLACTLEEYIAADANRCRLLASAYLSKIVQKFCCMNQAEFLEFYRQFPFPKSAEFMQNVRLARGVPRLAIVIFCYRFNLPPPKKSSLFWEPDLVMFQNVVEALPADFLVKLDLSAKTLLRCNCLTWTAALAQQVIVKFNKGLILTCQGQPLPQNNLFRALFPQQCEVFRRARAMRKAFWERYGKKVHPEVAAEVGEIVSFPWRGHLLLRVGYLLRRDSEERYDLLFSKCR